MSAFLVVSLAPIPNGPPCFLEGPEAVLPHALFLQTPKKPFDHSILFWRIGCDEILYGCKWSLTVYQLLANGIKRPGTYCVSRNFSPRGICRYAIRQEIHPYSGCARAAASRDRHRGMTGRPAESGVRRDGSGQERRAHWQLAGRTITCFAEGFVIPEQP